MTPVSVISSIVVFGLLLFAVLRLLSDLGAALPQNKGCRWITADRLQAVFPTDIPRRELLLVFLAAVVFRILIYWLSAVPIFLFAEPSGFSFDDFLARWNLWDAHHYINIAKGGYSYYIEKGAPITLVFFPLFPVLIKCAYLLVRNYDLAALTVSTLCYAGACCYLYRLAASEYKKSTAKKAVLYISFFPFAFFFGGMMSESVFLLTTVMTLYYIHKHRWAAVGLCGALSALSRSIGVFIVVPAAIEFCVHYDILSLLKKREIKQMLLTCAKKGLWLFLIPCGTLIYLLCNYVTAGDPFAFLEYEKMIWYQESTYFGKSLDLIFTSAFTNKTSFMLRGAIWIPQAMIYLFTAAALIYGMRRHKSKYTIYLLIYCIINTSISWPISGARYMSCAVPLFLILADFADRHPRAEHWITAIFAIGFGIYLTGYLLGKQIM